MKDAFEALSVAEADNRAREWLESVDGSARVGKRHHIVPRFLLSRFADENDQLLVRTRSADSGVSMRSISDMAVKDFYTAINVGGEISALTEDLLGVVEEGAARVLARLSSGYSFSRSHLISRQDRLSLETLVSLQLVRGMRTRRQLEHAANYWGNVVHRNEIAADEPTRVEFRPHQNEHLRLMGELGERIQDEISLRPISFVRLDSPLLLIGDEPVVLDPPDHLQRIRERDLRGYPRVTGIDSQSVIQMGNGRGYGVANADGVALPLSPVSAIYFGSRGSSAPAQITLAGRQAGYFARQINKLIIDESVDWVASHPSHPSFRRMQLPRPARISVVIDGNSTLSQDENQDTRRRPRRYRKPSAEELAIARSQPAIGHTPDYCKS